MYLNQTLVISNFLGNGFQATLRWKTNVLKIWKGHFSFFCKFLHDDTETVFWEYEVKPSKVFKSQFGHKQLLRKLFSSYLELKNECSKGLKRAFFIFFAYFWVVKLKTFCVKIRQSAEMYLNKNLVIGSFLETIFEAILSSKTNVVSVWKEHFSVFLQIF